MFHMIKLNFEVIEIYCLIRVEVIIDHKEMLLSRIPQNNQKDEKQTCQKSKMSCVITVESFYHNE